MNNGKRVKTGRRFFAGLPECFMSELVDIYIDRALTAVVRMEYCGEEYSGIQMSPPPDGFEIWGFDPAVPGTDKSVACRSDW